MVRDPLNWVASYMKSTVRTSLSWAELISRWKKQVCPPKGFFVINFNKWFTDVGYRKSLSAEFGLEFNDRWFARQAMPSSFGNRDVLNRWKVLAGNSEFNSIVQRYDLFDWNEKYFK